MLGSWSLILLVAVLSTGAAQTPQPPEATPSDEELKWLERRQQSIENEQDTLETRRSQADELLLRRTDAATLLAVQLLATAKAPSTRMVMCQAVAGVGVSDPTALDSRLIEPLLGALGDENDDVSGSAAAALAAYPDAGVAERLGALAGDPAQPLKLRRAALDALAPNIDRRSVAGQLLALLRPGDPITPMVVEALRPASRRDHGLDIDQWHAWWAEKKQISDAEWMTDRLALRAAQMREIRKRADQLERELRESRDQYDRIIDELLRLVHQLTPDEPQRDERLIAWLGHESEAFRLTAANLIKERIPDGVLPSESVQATLRKRLDDPSPDVRRSIAAIIGALTQPGDLKAVLSRLEVETNPGVRETLLRILGQLQNPAAIPALISEIDNPEADLNCVTEAAVSLGLLLTRATDGHPPDLTAAIGPLRNRLHGAPAGALRLQRSLLTTMVAVKNSAFAEDFASYLSATEPALLIPAIQGVAATGGSADVERIVVLTQNADTAVRRAACEAMGTLASEPSHAEALASRCDPAIEVSEPVRDAAWSSLTTWLSTQTPEQRLDWMGRLATAGSRRVDYLKSMADELVTVGADPTTLRATRTMLAKSLVEAGRDAEAIPFLRQIYDADRETTPEGAYMAGQAVLDASLRADVTANLDTLVQSMGTLATAEQRERLAVTLLEHLAALTKSDDHRNLDSLVELLATVGPEALGETWPGRFQKFLAAPEKTEASVPPPPDDQPPS
ncbi:MAG: HEAT repeat domain-containing protein [Planctomycetes bacterium]|nr:HEAT repeat domain-containing protein [Planctomycetota bacterium]